MTDLKPACAGGAAGAPCSCAGVEHAACLAVGITDVLQRCAADLQHLEEPTASTDTIRGDSLTAVTGRLQQARDELARLPMECWGRECTLPWVQPEDCGATHLGCVLRIQALLALRVLGLAEVMVCGRCWRHGRTHFGPGDSMWMANLLRAAHQQITENWAINELELALAEPATSDGGPPC